MTATSRVQVLHVTRLDGRKRVVDVETLLGVTDPGSAARDGAGAVLWLRSQRGQRGPVKLPVREAAADLRRLLGWDRRG